MRILAVHPGPAFSVSDVFSGWVRGLRARGAVVADLNLGDRLNFYASAHAQLDGTDEFHPLVDTEGAYRLASKGIAASCYEFVPDIVVIVSCFFVPPDVLDLCRARGAKVVVLHTESPYEDDKQLLRAAHADLNILNDPTNLDRFQAVAPSMYVAHAYDPEIHYQREPKADLSSDFCFVGTGYQSRMAFLEAVDWTGIDVTLAGNWRQVADDSPLLAFLAHERHECVDNTDAVDLYCASRASANLYRTEAERPDLSTGWAMGPREVELAASGCFFLRQPRGEGDELLPFVPTFDGPADFGDKLRWWLDRPEQRQTVADAALAAIQDRTFTNNAARLLSALDT